MLYRIYYLHQGGIVSVQLSVCLFVHLFVCLSWQPSSTSVVTETDVAENKRWHIFGDCWSC